MNNGYEAQRTFDILPWEVRQRYPGMVIVYSEDEHRVIGAGPTEDEAFDQAEASGVKGLWHISYGPDPEGCENV